MMLLLPMVASALDAKIDGIYYDFNYTTKTATVTFLYIDDGYGEYPYYSNYAGDIIIPSEVTYNGESYIVNSIGKYAFVACYLLTSVAIPNSITNIGECAFLDCWNLSSVYISDLVSWCNITFFDTPLYYAHHLYLNNQEIRDLVIPNGVTSINSNAFSGCNITSVTIPNSVTSIGAWAFYGCDNLNSVTIPNSVTSIGDYAFYRFQGTSLIIGSGVTSIGNSAFEESNLTDVTCLAIKVPNTKDDAFC